MILALLPAHNEAEGIEAAVESLKAQTMPPDRIVVIADNCTDNTAELAEQAGASVFVTFDNVCRKAGALNQALNEHLPGLTGNDAVLIMDADSSLVHTWIEDAMLWMPDTGAVSGAYIATQHPGLIPLMQHVEYTQQRRRIARSQGKVAVLSGAASMFYAYVLEAIADERGNTLPGFHGDYYRVDSLTEDFEITLAAKQLGADPRSPSCLIVETDVMQSIPSLWGQRLRWQRGYLETLVTYPLKSTWRDWVVQFVTYGMSLFPLTMLAFVWLAVSLGGFHFEPRWFLLIPVFVLADVVEAWKGGIRARFIALLMFPLSAYTAFRNAVYWRALYLALRKTHAAWS